jgi:hypothetical protein
MLVVPVTAPPADSRERDCETLPASALRPYTCSPRAECLKRIPNNLDPRRLDARQRECNEQPTSGRCFGPESYDPRKDCRERHRK